MSDPEVCYKGSRHLKESILVSMVAGQVSRDRGSKGSFYYPVTMSAASDWAVMLLEREKFF